MSCLSRGSAIFRQLMVKVEFQEIYYLEIVQTLSLSQSE